MFSSDVEILKGLLFGRNAPKNISAFTTCVLLHFMKDFMSFINTWMSSQVNSFVEEVLRSFIPGGDSLSGSNRHLRQKVLGNATRDSSRKG